MGNKILWNICPTKKKRTAKLWSQKFLLIFKSDIAPRVLNGSVSENLDWVKIVLVVTVSFQKLSFFSVRFGFGKFRTVENPNYTSTSFLSQKNDRKTGDEFDDRDLSAHNVGNFFGHCITLV